ncbi:MAG: protein kinase [Acidobacteriota bacterium]|nr:protein kinase [Acidobacteriota bacterium]
MKAANLIGQTLDGKYKIERELGRGGMGAVYLALHVGTERAIAVKVIAPEFMRREEFVERFRREARAAGRLRHPNVVDVTDFGLADTDLGRVAYLVMEYLDGCTLGEVLEEEKSLPLSWTLDILEQTCSAVAEAHQQGIIHRDLKPDNIWLEPNSRGGYTVKVLDFGIAKLEEPMSEDEDEAESPKSKVQTFSSPPVDLESATIVLGSNLTTEIDESATLNFEIQNPKSQIPNLDEGATAIFPTSRATVADNNGGAATNQEAVATQLLSDPALTENRTASSSTAALTRVGAVLGTPLYMSPEQCRGERLDPRADVYSLGVIAYQMLSGETPFKGNFTEVIKAHQEKEPPPLETKKLRRRVKQTIHSALAKSPDDRPASAIDFSSKLRASSEGIGTLLRRALVIYSEHLPTFLWLSFLLQLPSFLITLSRVTVTFLRLEEMISSAVSGALLLILGFSALFVGIFFASILLGVTTWIVAQLLAVPLRPVNWKKALAAAKTKWRGFAGTVTITTLISFAALIIGLIPGAILLGISVSVNMGALATAVFSFLSILVMLVGFGLGVGVFVFFYLVSPVVAMENLRGRRALRRSAQLVRRSLSTTIAAFSLSFFAPLLLSAALAVFVSALIKSNDIFTIEKTATGVNIRLRDESRISVGKDFEEQNRPAQTTAQPETEEEKKLKKDFQEAIYEAIFQILWFPILVLLSSLTSVITGLLYLKSRQAGGEGLGELLTEFEENDRTQKRWQLRLREKLAQSGRHTSRNTKKSNESGELRV